MGQDAAVAARMAAVRGMRIIFAVSNDLIAGKAATDLNMRNVRFQAKADILIPPDGRKADFRCGCAKERFVSVVQAKMRVSW